MRKVLEVWTHGKKLLTKESRCRKCTQDHATSACQATENKLECINCLIENKKGKTYNLLHLPTSDRCPARIARIEGLKGFYVSNNSEKESQSKSN